MRQALHIFKKDFWYLRYEICLIVGLSAAFATIEPHSLAGWGVRMLLAIGTVYLIARLMHAETIPGDNQFWITRPYRWTSLLGAKLLFILVFVNAPILAARLFILIAKGFQVVPNLPGLLWSQLFLILAALLPIASLAAVTSGLVPFSFSALILLASGLGIHGIIGSVAFTKVRQSLIPIQWVWDSIAMATLIAIAVPILYLQYKGRSTFLSRTVGIGVAALGAAAYLLVPWPLALEVQTRFPKKAFDTSSFQIALRPGPKTTLIKYRWSGVRLDLPIALEGVPNGVDVHTEALTLTVEGTEGRTWKSGRYYIPGLLPNGSGTNIFNAIIETDQEFFFQQREHPVTFRGSLYLTLFGDSRSQVISRDGEFVLLSRSKPVAEPVNVGDSLRCTVFPTSAGPRSSYVFERVYCLSPFRWPAQRVDVKFSETDTRPIEQPISYSPFPASLSFNDYAGTVVSAKESRHPVTIVVKDRLKTFRLDFEATVPRLADYRCSY